LNAIFFCPTKWPLIKLILCLLSLFHSHYLPFLWFSYRYYAIIYPVKSRYMCTMSHTRIIITLTWVFSLLSAIPILPLQVRWLVIQLKLSYTLWFCFYLLSLYMSSWLHNILIVTFLKIHLEVGVRYPAFWCVKDAESYIFWPFYECYMLTLILIVPSIVMTYTYGCICKKLWLVVQTRAAMISGQDTV